MAQPRRRRVERGIVERLDAQGRHLGYEIKVKDASGKARRRTVHGGLQAARDELAKARTRRATRQPEPQDPRITVGDVIDEFEQIHLPTVRPNTQMAYHFLLIGIRKDLGSKRITNVSRRDVRGFIAALTPQYKASVVGKHYAALRTLYGFARRDLELPVVFPAVTNLPDPADDQREHRVLTDSELACLTAESLLFRTIAVTGCRRSEALGLTRRDLGDGTITFRTQIDRHGELAPLKSKYSQRTVEVPRGLTAALKLAAGHERVFDVTQRDTNRQWEAIRRAARLDDPQPVIHDLRHTHASRLIAAGLDPVSVAARLGDRLETVLRIYSHEWDAVRRSDERRRLIEQLYGDGMATGMATSSRKQPQAAVANLTEMSVAASSRK